MASPFIYTPSASSSTRSIQPIPYVTTYHNWYDQSPTSPFIPDTRSFTSTPFTTTSALPPSRLPPTPYTCPISLPDVREPERTGHLPTWTDVRRPRSMSWAGAPQIAHTMGSRRCLSDTTSICNTSIPTPWSTPLYLPALPPLFEQPGLHHYLSAHSPGRHQVLYDLALPTFSPMRLLEMPGQHPREALLSSDDLVQPATEPHLFRLLITCPTLSQPPLTIELSFHGIGPATPITVGDVLFVLHSRLHERISHRDWAALTEEARWEAGRAYITRCANSGTGMVRQQRADGVKRVDLLGGKARFVGLEWTGENRARLVVN